MRHYTEANRAMWNKTADVHAEVTLEGLLERVGAPDFSTFDAVEHAVFARLGLAGKTVAQPSCNNGRELISVRKAGAGCCVGFDISEKFIEQGERLAEAGDVDVEFVRTSVYDIPHEYDAQFDLVYVTIGALGWLPDMEAYFRVIARLLKPGGHLFLYEMHPILDMFDPEKGLEVVTSYFTTEPDALDESPDYYDPSRIVKQPSYWFHHKLSDIVGNCLKSGLDLTSFEEYPHDLSEVYKPFEAFEAKPPLSYSLTAQKKV